MTLKKYLIHAGDVKYCPTEGCQYAGFVRLNADEDIECLEPLECENCSNKWVDPAQASAHKISIIRLRKRLMANSGVLKTLIARTVKTTPCPQCGIAIQKTGGCDHIYCRACNYEFCWVC